MSESDVTVTRLFGGPGSGKTTVLLDKVEEILEQDGVTIHDILVVSYTRAATAEVRDRLAEQPSISPRSLKGNVSTMRAKAYELSSFSRNDVVGESDKQEFCEDYGVELEDEYGGAGRRTARSATIGDKVITTSQWLQRTRYDASDWYDVPFQWNVEEVYLPPEVDPNTQEGNKCMPTWPPDDDRIDIPETIHAWRAYKGEHGLVGFTDMLERVKQRVLVPNVDYLVIDEFQDITTPQYDVYERWKPHMRDVLITGDGDQVVHAWQGTDPNLLLGAEHDNNEILPNSYRLPSNVLNVINRETRHIDKRQKKDFKPRKENGAVEAIESPSMLELAWDVRYTVEKDGGIMMVLFCARYQMFQFIDEFLPSGIPFSTLTDQRMRTDRLTQCIRAVEALDVEEPVSGLEARRLADMLQDSMFGTNDRDDLFDAINDRQEEVGIDDITNIEFASKETENLAPFALDSSSASDMVRKVTSFQRKSVNAYLDGGYEEMDPSRVRVGTIHSAKDREADHVFMATGLTEKVVRQIAASASDEELETRGIKEFTATMSSVPLIIDNECRVFYVGMSHTRERLIVLGNLVTGAPVLPISVLLHNEIREEPTQGLVDDAQELPAPEPEA